MSNLRGFQGKKLVHPVQIPEHTLEASFHRVSASNFILDDRGEGRDREGNFVALFVSIDPSCSFVTTKHRARG